jgi:hypothetical protein
LRPAAQRQIVDVLATGDEVADVHSDVPGDHSQQRGRQVSPRMKRHRSTAAVGVTLLAMRSALANLCEPHSFQNTGGLSRLEDWNVTHCYATLTVCVPMNSRVQ